MAITSPPQTNSDSTDPSNGQTVLGIQSQLSPFSPSFFTNYQPNVSAQATSIPRSPIISNQGFSTQRPKLTTSPSEIGSNSQEAGPLPEKVGEIGYVPPPAPTLPRSLVTRDPSPQTELGVELPAPPHSLRPARSSPAWSPAISSSFGGHRSTRTGKPRERITASKMFLKPILLVVFGVVVLSLTFVGLIQVQERINHNNNRNNRAKAAANNNDDSSRSNDPGSTDGSSDSGVTSNASFVYMGTFFIVALLVEIWIFVGALRRLHHRLGLWVDQEYSAQLPDLSDPEATFSPPVLPRWARVLRIKPQTVRRPLLPSYMAVLGIIRNGGRTGANSEGTGDVEDGEVIRTLAIGQGQAAPAFDGEEFQRSTVILSGPPKRNSTLSTSPSVRSGGLLHSLSRTFTGGFGSRNSATQTSENDLSTNTNRRVSVASILSNARRTSGAHSIIPEAVEHQSTEHSTTIELSEVPVTHNAAYIHHSRRAA
ncbi:hypothetical protein MJO29_001237 [Puccinia striiformis f. sp. tritici]|uniref:Uncharacterized protein n=2 Tax=Puccinia striiformis TaxID=27350 RepID=A0A0L0URU1_9BASI|nr:hypothetical protein Pst134EA_003500 [Puccinia striiformis f. sp. tritici]KAI9611696.1 hypothetical protein H4Q26_008651 [Puccinia striiformis f. sp. tritici PST-130]KNE89690.1 hypothetical protein PSTG_16853 [Puccinia striiformis f. sp. tritici PST-78]POW02251.1 hypothetical protein PSTT_12000 [Puccinia striiformis]KAH9472901.1 hypothetical protein Pst134EA_003500 [Puccinia striiformis f. sp. tritici]KAI7965489.1 hypothetical protein MJO29_001237 [Puccinia striiformis f. sp. tritici]